MQFICCFNPHENCTFTCIVSCFDHHILAMQLSQLSVENVPLKHLQDLGRDFFSDPCNQCPAHGKIKYEIVSMR